MDAYIQNFILKFINPQTPYAVAAISILLVWSLFWKAFALWKSARNNERIWFIAILFLNTLGILEIAYIFFIAREKMTINKIRTNIKSYKIRNPLKQS